MSGTDKHGNAPLPDAELEAFFDAGRADAATPDAALMSRVMADAAEVADRRALFAGEKRQAQVGWIAAALAAVGGWPAAAALASVAVAGVWIGALAPDAVGALAFGWAETTTDYDFVELLPGLDLLETEG